MYIEFSSCLSFGCSFVFSCCGIFFYLWLPAHAKDMYQIVKQDLLTTVASPTSVLYSIIVLCSICSQPHESGQTLKLNEFVFLLFEGISFHYSREKIHVIENWLVR